MKVAAPQNIQLLMDVIWTFSEIAIRVYEHIKWNGLCQHFLGT